LNDDPPIKPPHKLCYKYVTDRFLILAVKTVSFVPLTNDDIITRKYTDTFCTMYKRVKRNLQSGSLIERPKFDPNETTDVVLSFLCNLAYRTVIVPWFLGIGLIESMLECLKIMRPSQPVHRIIWTIHNISRHDDGADELRKFDGLSIVKDFQIKRPDDLNDESSLDLSITIALLSTSEQIRSDNKRKNKILNQLLQVTIDADKVSFAKKKLV